MRELALQKPTGRFFWSTAQRQRQRRGLLNVFLFVVRDRAPGTENILRPRTRAIYAPVSWAGAAGLECSQEFDKSNGREKFWPLFDMIDVELGWLMWGEVIEDGR